MATDRRPDGPAEELPRVLSTRSAARLGISRAALRHRIDRRGWQPLARGIVLTSPHGPTREDWALVGMELASPRAALSGWDALRTIGLGRADPPCGPVLVLDRGGDHRTVGQVRIRPTRRPFRIRLLPGEHPTLPYLPVVHTARAVADTALAYRTLPPVRALVTSAIQKGRCTPAELAAELEAGPRNGSGPLRRAIADVLDGARSIAEAEAVDVLRRCAVPAFELNVDLVDSTGRVLAVADVLWRELRAIAEIDSREFHFSEADWKETLRRHNLLTGFGLALGHYPPSQIRSAPRAWGRQVESWLRGRARELAVPYVPGGGPVRHPGGHPPPLVVPCLPLM